MEHRGNPRWARTLPGQLLQEGSKLRPGNLWPARCSQYKGCACRAAEGPSQRRAQPSAGGRVSAQALWEPGDPAPRAPSMPLTGPGGACSGSGVRQNPVSPDALGQVAQHYWARFLISLERLLKPQTLNLGVIYTGRLASTKYFYEKTSYFCEKTLNEIATWSSRGDPSRL